MANITSLCVYCGSSNFVSSFFLDEAYRFGEMMGAQGIRLVYGGGDVGMMGRLAHGCLSKQGSVLGIIPDFLHDREVSHEGLTELRVVASMHERKRQMAEESDGFVILPGGVGTLDEMFEIVTWRQLGLHDKPIILANLQGYWTGLQDLLAKMLAERFTSDRSLFVAVDRIEAILPALARTEGSHHGVDGNKI